MFFFLTSLFSLFTMDILSMSLISFGLWFIFHNIFDEIFGRLLFKCTNDCSMPIISWKLLFNALFITASINVLLGSSKSFSETFSHFAISNDDIKWDLSFALMIGGLMHSVNLSVSLKGVYSSFFWKQISLVLFLSAAYNLMCSEFSFKVILLISLMDQLLWLVRSLCISEKPGQQKSFFLLSFSLVYCLLWSFVHLFLTPVYILMPAAFIKASGENMPHLLLLNMCLWIYFFSELVSSPTLEVLKDLVFCRQINTDLFCFKANQLTRSNFILLKKQLEQERKKNERLQNNDTQNTTETGRKVNSATLIQTVKCYLAVKRRLKNVRMKGLQSNAFDSLEENNKEDCVEISPTECDGESSTTDHLETAESS